MNNLNTMFHYQNHDLVTNQAGSLSAYQSERLNRVFHDSFKAIRKDILQDLTFLGPVNVFFFIAAGSFGTQIFSLLMLAVTISYMRTKIIGKHSIIAIYKRRQQAQNDPNVITIQNVTPDKFTFHEGYKVYSFPYFEYWFRSYDWFDFAEMSSLGWYVFSDNSGIEIILAPHQYAALDTTSIYTCYCFVDSSKFAYVLSIEDQTSF